MGMLPLSWFQLKTLCLISVLQSMTVWSYKDTSAVISPTDDGMEPLN